MMSRLSLASAVSGAALLLGTPLAWQLAQPPETVGEVPAPSGRTDVQVPAPSSRTGGGVPTPSSRTERAQDSADDGEDAADPAPVEPPVGLSIPAIGVDAAIVPVGLEPDRSMEIPQDVATIGWYEPGVIPGQQGTAVISGHVDSREQGRGAFFDLRRLDVDDVVSLDHGDGTTSDWRVTARTVYPKDELPIADIFTRFGDTRLVLITCGGAFDNTTRHYDDNVVVYTEPLTASAT